MKYKMLLSCFLTCLLILRHVSKKSLLLLIGCFPVPSRLSSPFYVWRGWEAERGRGKERRGGKSGEESLTANLTSALVCCLLTKPFVSYGSSLPLSFVSLLACLLRLWTSTIHDSRRVDG